MGGIITALLILTTGSISACTGFIASTEDRVLVGTNEDWYNPEFYLHFFPAEEGKYGRVIFEVEMPEPWDSEWICPMQGLNTQGLFFDLYSTPNHPIVDSKDKPIFNSTDPDYYQYALNVYCLATCTTVEETLAVIDQYNLEVLYNSQLFIADKYGDAAIIEGDDIVRKTGDFQVVTNFLQCHPELGWYPCWRYNLAVSMLGNMTELTVDYFRDILDAVHLEGSNPTRYSNIYDLKQGVIHVYDLHNYEKVVDIDLESELAKGERVIYLHSLFEPEDNRAPLVPDAPYGEVSGLINTEYKYMVKRTSDPDGDLMYYLFDWGDGTNSSWIYSTLGGTHITANHEWKKQGSYEIRVKTIDIYGKESDWSDPLPVSMPKNKILPVSPLIIQFLENHPHLFSILRQILLFLG